ncbi:extensin-like [Arachis ipaensis]|uniref:extensin-like n=1 Tax=Arachis ipaensis TaxID=130454 RepID=UPI0007AF28FD|nr:extensin-like [Arachis ipaensis]
MDNLTNNMCEVFNAKIVNYRSKPILTMCEEIRCYLMRRMVKHKELLENYPGKLALVQQKRLDCLIRPSNKWLAEWTGMSCIHAVTAIRKRHDHPGEYDTPNTQSAPSSQTPSSQDDINNSQQHTPDFSSVMNPTPSMSVATTLRPVTRRTPFRPPHQLPSTTHQIVQPKTSKMRPKQKIFRPPGPRCPSSLPPLSQPAPPQPQPQGAPPGSQPSQVRPGPSTAATTRLFKFIPNPPSINPKK